MDTNLSKLWEMWRTEELGVLQSKGSQRVRDILATENNNCKHSVSPQIVAEAEALWAVRAKPYLESESIAAEWITGPSEGKGSQCNQLANKYPGGLLERQCHISNSSLIHVAASWMAVASITVIIISKSPRSWAHAWPPSPLTMETLLTVCHASTGVADDREWLVSPELIYLHDQWNASTVMKALCDSMDCSLPGSSIYGIFQARILEWVAISFSRWKLYLEH